ncbi:Dicer-like protein 1 [Dissophora globulifera]|uniref:Dicer-like protein 1 n=1 Tax=Dissophora globulifera TaxID=979702 RepID=A0A9P6UWP1_9FUNG|nr:Dicer-like protein 1 [Dissophora globulifera]
MTKSESTDLLIFDEAAPVTPARWPAREVSPLDLLSSSCQGLALRPALTPIGSSPVRAVQLPPAPLVPVAVTAVTAAAGGGSGGLSSHRPPSPTVVMSNSPGFRPQPIASTSQSSTRASPTRGRAPPSAANQVTVPAVEPDPYLIPRRYQSELFRKAIRSNIIAVMDTGSGKTLVAVLLIREMIKRQLEAEASLAEQAAVIRANSAAQVIELSGVKQTRTLNEDIWKDIFIKADVVVLTAQILLDHLRRGHVKMRRIHLLVFDECHHARKDHPFCCIMREFYHSTADAERPKIFGMTASPSLDTSSKIENSARELETVMDAKVFTVDQQQVLSFVERPREIVVQYHSSPSYQETVLTQSLRKRAMDERLDPLSSTIDETLKHLGPWCVNRLWHLFIERASDSREIKPVSSEMRTAITLVKSMPLPPPICTADYVSPRVIKLIQLLRVAAREMKDDFCGIIFVQRRNTAIALCLLLQELAEFKEVFRVQILAGHSEDSENVMRMSYREQTVIISNFRNKVYNLLVATSVAEEGLDIQPCNFVIRFDPVTTTISYIQSRGRARKKDSRFIMMHEFDNRTEEATLEKIRRAEETMKEWSHGLDEDRVMRNPMDVEDDSALEKLMPLQTYKIPTTGALLTLDSSISLIYHYCSTLSSDEFCSFRPDFNVISNGSSGFVCDLILPPNAPFRVVQSDRASTKSMARKSAAFKACEKLHFLGALSDNLIPIVTEPAEDDMSEEVRVVDSKIKNKSYPTTSPKFWSPSPRNPGEPVQLWGCVVKLAQEDLEALGGKDRYRSMCLLTYRPLPSSPTPFNLYIDGDKRLVTLMSFPTPVVVDEDRLILLQHFTLVLFERMCRKTFECALESIPYFIAPLTKDFGPQHSLQSGIAWDDVSLGQDMNPLPFLDDRKDEQALLDSIVTFRHDHGRDFFVKRIVREFVMSDVMPPDQFKHELALWDDSLAKSKSTPSKEDETWNDQGLDSSRKTFAAYFKWRYKVECAEDDIMLGLDRVRKMRNNLQAAIRGEDVKKDNSMIVVPLSLCERCPVRADVLRMSQLIPSVLFSLDSTLLVQEAQERIGLQMVRLDYLQVAFTTSSANRDFQYERLELLGDSFLKFSSTIRLFIINPAKDEGQLHANRIRIISNRALLGHATTLEIYRHVSSTPFHRKSWRPTRFIVGKEPGKEVQSHDLSNKTLADVIEASLGAAYRSGGVRTGLAAAKALRIPFDEFADWDDFSKVYSRAKATTQSADERYRLGLSAAQLKGVREVEKLYEYEFKDPLLFVEAMTHASSIRNDSVCYQRLEFLGDAVLDFQVVQYYYDKYGDASPGVITLFKDASVNNGALGAMALKWGLHRHLDHCSAALIGAMTRTTSALESLKSLSPRETLEGEYWQDVTMPKVLGDLVESMLGAIFVDSGFDFGVITGVFTRLIRPFLDEYVKFESLNLHPSKRLLESLQAEGCSRFKFEMESSQETDTQRYLRRIGLTVHGSGGEVDSPQKCHFRIHDKIVATATATGAQVEELRKQVALQTIMMLKADPQLLGSLCSCPKRQRPRHISVWDRYASDLL